MDLSKLVKSVIEKEVQLSSLTAEEQTAVGEALTLMKSHLGNGDMLDKKEQLDLAKNGQWSFKKAIKPGPPLNYGKINPTKNPDASPDESHQATRDMQTMHDNNANTIDYQSNPAKSPTWAGAKQKKLETDAKIEAAKPATALDEIAVRQKRPSLKQSESEPHEDDRQHEAKEQANAKSIKEDAQEILDLHKNGQWTIGSMEKGDNDKSYRRKTVELPLTPEEKVGIRTRTKEVLADAKAGLSTAPRQPGSTPSDVSNGYDEAVKPAGERGAITRAAKRKAADDASRKAAPKPKDIKDWF